jgi:aryl-alcohol dehydrogenase-like predicted oxidoreductase
VEYRTLGRTGLQVSLLSLGTGGPSAFGQQNGATFADQHALVRGALDLGINFFDTAAAYRESEDILGRALEGVPRDTYYIASKCSLTERWGGKKLVDAESVLKQCERSLRRLRTDAIDVYQLHGVEPLQYDEVVERLYPALESLQAAGKIRFIGLTEMFNVDPAHTMLERSVPSGLWDTIMVKYGMLNQTAAETVFPLCLKHNVGVLNMAPIRVKLARPDELRATLADWTSRGLLQPNVLPDDDSLGWLVQGDATSIISAGYKFGAAHPAISAVLSGTANLDHLKDNVAAVLGAPLPPEHVARLECVFAGIAEGGV